MPEDVTAGRHSKIWLMLSMFVMHGLGWCGVYRFLCFVLEPGKMLSYIGIGILIFFLVDCILRWQEVFWPLVYHTKWYLLLEAFALYLYSIFRKDIPLETDALFMGLLVIVGHFWCLYLQGVHDYLETHAELKHVPGESMLRINTRVILGLLGVLTIFLFLALLPQFDQAMGWLAARFGRAVTSVILAIRHIVQLLEKIFHITPGGPEEEPEQPSAAYIPEMTDSEEGLGYILGISVFSIVMIVVFWRMLRKAKLQADLMPGPRPDFHYHGSEEDIVEDIEEERLPFLPIFRNNRERIRYRFRRRVKRHYKKNVPPVRTSWEFNREMQQDRNEPGLDALTDLYDIARYSKREILDSDLKK